MSGACLAPALETGLDVTLQISWVFPWPRAPRPWQGPMAGESRRNLGGVGGVLAAPVKGFSKQSPLGTWGLRIWGFSERKE